MVPGILVLLVTMLTLFLSAMNMYEKRNRDIGTNKCYQKKTPVHHRKLFPFWVLGLMLLSVGLLIARLVFRIPLGNIGLILPVYHGVFTGYTRHRFVHFKLYRHPTTGHVYCLVFTVIFILMSGLFTLSKACRTGLNKWLCSIPSAILWK
jgi:ABC-2 type transport system permease protein